MLRYGLAFPLNLVHEKLYVDHYFYCGECYFMRNPLIFMRCIFRYAIVYILMWRMR